MNRFFRAFLTALAAGFPVVLTAQSSDPGHVETKAFTFDLAPNQQVSRDLACQSGNLQSGGYSVNNFTTTVRAVSHYPAFGSTGIAHWRVKLRNFGDTGANGAFHIHVLCSGPAPVGAATGAGTGTGTRIYFQKFVHTALDINNNPIHVEDIFRADPDGSNLERLTVAPPASEHDSYGAAVSPDGSRVVFATFRHRDGTPARNTAELYVANSDGSAPQRLTNNTVDDDTPRWCGDVPAQIVWYHDGDIKRMNADGSGVETVIGTAADEYDPDCTSDGSKITFIRRLPSGQQQVFLANADGTGELPLAGTAILNSGPRISPSGTEILFLSDQGNPPTGHMELYRMRTSDADMDGQGDELTQLTSNSPGSGVTGAAWSPDGSSALIGLDGVSGQTLHTLDLSSLTVSPPLLPAELKMFANDWH